MISFYIALLLSYGLNQIQGAFYNKIIHTPNSLQITFSQVESLKKPVMTDCSQFGEGWYPCVVMPSLRCIEHPSGYFI